MKISSQTPSVTAAILAGGLGTRLRPAVHDAPKVLANVNGRPFITILLDQLAEAAIERVVLLTGYKAAQVRRALGTRYAGITLAYSVEDATLGTAGALRQALPQIRSNLLLLMNGDSYCEIDLVALIAEHCRRRADWTMALTRVADTSRFGRARMNAAKRITRFEEKQDGAGPGWINAGVHVFATDLVAKIPPGQFLSLERDFLPGWVRSRRVYGFQTESRFLDIGTPSAYAGATAFFQLFNPEPAATAARTVAVGSGSNNDRLLSGT